MNETLSVTQVIQLILAPAVMINACGLLLLTVSNRYSLVLNRIRLLNEEKRRLTRKSAEPGFGTLENQRMESVVRQIERLDKRARVVRNAAVCYFLAIALFVATGLFLGIDILLSSIDLQPVLLGLFLVGMATVFVGVVSSGIDVLAAYKIVEFEVAADE